MFAASDLSKSDLVLLLEMIEKVEYSDSIDGYLKIINDLNSLIPFGVFSHCLFERKNDKDDIDTFYVGTYPDEWVSRYVEKKYALLDPIVARCVKYQRWTDTYREITPPEIFKKESEDFGLGDGVTVFSTSLRRPEFSLFSLSGDEMDHSERTKFIVQRLANPLHQTIQRIRVNGSKRDLTDQQRTVLNYLANGESQKAIADKMHLCQSRIRDIVSEIRALFDTENTCHSVFTATKNGEI